MRDAPPIAAGPYVALGLLLSGVGGIGMVFAGVFNLGHGRIAPWAVVAFVGLFVLEATRRLWEL